MLLVLFAVFFAMILINVPIAFSVGIGVFVALVLTTGLPVSIIPIRMYNMINTFPFLAIPLYIIAGHLMNKSGITNRLIALAKVLVGFIRGGIGMAAVLAAMFFGGVSGSSLADTAAIGSVMIPEMRKEKYDKNFSVALIASAGTTGGIIPPSIAMVLYGVVAGTSIAKLFLAGAIPGVLLGLSFMLVCFLFSWKHKYPVGPKPTVKGVFKALLDGLLPLGMPVIIVGGIYGGVFTATEAGIIATIYALILGLIVYRTLKLKDILDSIIESVEVASIPVLVVAFSGGFAFLSSYADVPRTLSTFIYSVTSSKIVILLLINVMLLIIGMFMEGPAVYPIVVPIFLPILMEMGISPVHFGVIIVLNLSIGLITPPVGATLYTACAVAKADLLSVAKKALYFIAVGVGVLIASTYIPWISEFLPGLMD